MRGNMRPSMFVQQYRTMEYSDHAGDSGPTLHTHTHTHTPHC